MPTTQESQRTVAGLRDGWETHVDSDGKCYFPCNQCKGLKIIILVRKTTKIHCFMYGHCEGGHTFRPIVSYSLYMSLY
jgi:hypothetical protein